MAIDPKSVPLARVSWRPSYRLIHSRFPTVGLYDAIADPADLDAVFAIEALANPRLRDEIGELQLVEPAERVSGPGATPVMAAFTHLNPEGSDAQPAELTYASVLDPDDYGPSQRLGIALRQSGSWGIRYPSVRDPGGECVAIFRPRALRHARSALHIGLHWDGQRITHWFEKRAPHPLER
jgi:hypothetical protein